MHTFDCVGEFTGNIARNLKNMLERLSNKYVTCLVASCVSSSVRTAKVIVIYTDLLTEKNEQSHQETNDLQTV